MDRSGVFITFEGGEGAGKTTQIEALRIWLEEQGYEVVKTREPGGTPEAESVRNLLVQRDGGEWSALSEVLLLYAARVMHVEKVIKPALASGKAVICDRFSDSTYAYQGYGHGLDVKKIKEIECVSLGLFKPDLTFMLDIEARKGLERSTRRLSDQTGSAGTEDRFERLEIDFHERLRQGFLTIANNEPNRCVIVDALQSVDDIQGQIRSKLKQFLQVVES